MKLHQLRDFVAIAQPGSLRGAARALGLAQPALSRSWAAQASALWPWRCQAQQ